MKIDNFVGQYVQYNIPQITVYIARRLKSWSTNCQARKQHFELLRPGFAPHGSSAFYDLYIFE